MSKNKKIKETTIQNYYDLKTEKIDELVAILKGEKVESEVSYNVAEVTGEGTGKKEFDPYKVDKFSRIPVWVKALFIKWWFSGLVCYFVMFGINSMNKLDGLDSVLLCGIVMGIITDIFVNPLFRYMESDKREYNAYMMFPFPFRAFWTFFTNILYYTLILTGVNFAYAGVNALINIISETKSQIYMGVEPLLFGLFAVALDMAFIGVKNGVVKLIKRRKTLMEEKNV